MTDPVIVPPVVAETVRSALAERDRRQGLPGMTRTAALVAAELAVAPVTTPDTVRQVAAWHQQNPGETLDDGRSTVLAGVWGGRAGRDWAMSMLSRVAAPAFIDSEEEAKPKAAGIAVVAADTGRVLLLQRAFDPTGEDEHGGKWEFPGGKLDEGEGAYEAAQREFCEEARIPVPGRLAGDWTSPNGIYHGFVHVVPSESEVELNVDHEDRHVSNPDDPDGDNVEVVAWWSIDDADGNSVLRQEVREATPWDELRQPVAVAAALAQVAAIGPAELLPIIREAPGKAKLKRTSKRLAAVDRDLRNRLHAGAEVAMADGLRRAGVKVTQRAGKRSKAVQASVASCGSVYPTAVLAAAGITEQEALAHAFDAFGDKAETWIARAQRRKERILAEELGVEAARLERTRDRWHAARAVALAVLVGGLTHLAIRRLTKDHPHDPEGEGDDVVSPLVPGGLIGDTLAAADGKTVSGDPYAGTAEVDKWGPGVTLEVIAGEGGRAGIIPDGGRVTEHIVWRWNDSERPFDPHVDLDGTAATAETIRTVWAKDPEVFPYNTTYWFPGDHHGCLCSWDSTFDVGGELGGEAMAAALGCAEGVTAAAFDPTQHPRHGKGVREGGRFRGTTPETAEHAEVVEGEAVAADPDMPTREHVYGREVPIREQITKFRPQDDLEQPTALLRRILVAEGVPHGDEAYVQWNDADQWTSHIGWDHEVSPPIPFISLGFYMNDPLTVIHEAAHAKVNAGRLGTSWESAHGEDWERTFTEFQAKYLPELMPEAQTAAPARVADGRAGRDGDGDGILDEDEKRRQRWGAVRDAVTAEHPGVKLDVTENAAGIVEVSRIVVPEEERNQGIGQRVMERVLAEADGDGKTVALTPSSDFGGSKTKLTKWYRDLGFVPNKGKEFGTREAMIRRPGGGA